MNYISLIENDLDLDKDELYKLKNIIQLKKFEKKLRSSPKFMNRKSHSRYNLMSALHFYQNLLQVLNNKKKKMDY